MLGVLSAGMTKKCVSESLRPIAGFSELLFQTILCLKNWISTGPYSHIYRGNVRTKNKRIDTLEAEIERLTTELS